uniref:Uncharacterized protein n=1 Tax=Timema monikensis TaxID=170555 RepID=A0A7R9EI74_9NEOP|nr:unnamed protein product [Timema monikensis]
MKMALQVWLMTASVIVSSVQCHGVLPTNMENKSSSTSRNKEDFYNRKTDSNDHDNNPKYIEKLESMDQDNLNIVTQRSLDGTVPIWQRRDKRLNIMLPYAPIAQIEQFTSSEGIDLNNDRKFGAKPIFGGNVWNHLPIFEGRVSKKMPTNSFGREMVPRETNDEPLINNTLNSDGKISDGPSWQVNNENLNNVRQVSNQVDWSAAGRISNRELNNNSSREAMSDVTSCVRGSKLFRAFRSFLDTLYSGLFPHITNNVEEAVTLMLDCPADDRVGIPVKSTREDFLKWFPTLFFHENAGRKVKLKKMLLKSLLALKMVALGVILPATVALATLQSWKAVTISLLALGLAAIVGLKNLLSKVVTLPSIRTTRIRTSGCRVLLLESNRRVQGARFESVKGFASGVDRTVSLLKQVPAAVIILEEFGVFMRIKNKNRNMIEVLEFLFIDYGAVVYFGGENEATARNSRYSCGGKMNIGSSVTRLCPGTSITNLAPLLSGVK